MPKEQGSKSRHRDHRRMKWASHSSNVSPHEMLEIFEMFEMFENELKPKTQVFRSLEAHESFKSLEK